MRIIVNHEKESRKNCSQGRVHRLLRILTVVLILLDAFMLPTIVYDLYAGDAIYRVKGTLQEVVTTNAIAGQYDDIGMRLYVDGKIFHLNGDDIDGSKADDVRFSDELQLHIGEEVSIEYVQRLSGWNMLSYATEISVDGTTYLNTSEMMLNYNNDTMRLIRYCAILTIAIIAGWLLGAGRIQLLRSKRADRA